MKKSLLLHLFPQQILCFLLACHSGYAQERQQALMPGIYHLNLEETPLHYIPQSVFKPSQHSDMHIQTTPLATLQQWGTQMAIVSYDTTNGQQLNGIVFLNTQTDSIGANGFAGWQTAPIFFQEIDSMMRNWPTYGSNPLEHARNGNFNFQANWFSIYKLHNSTEAKQKLGQNGIHWYTKLSIEAGAFSLFQQRPIHGIIYNNMSDSIPVYTDAVVTDEPKEWLRLHENIFVRQECPDGLWLQAILYELLPVEREDWVGGPTIHGHLKETIGWIRQEDLYRGQWTPQLRAMPSYRFEAAGTSPSVDNGYTTPGMLDAIKVIDKKCGQTIQIITHIGAEIRDSLPHCLHYIDANFDGYPDIMASYADGGAGPNYLNIFFLFDPGSKQFVRDDTLSSLSQVEIDTVGKVIHSAWRAGAAQHGAAQYRYIGGKLQQTYLWEQVWGSGFFAMETESIRKANGQWKETIRYGTTAMVDTVAIYSKADKKIKPTALVPGITYFQIRDEKPLWYQVQTQYPDTLMGWIPKEMLYPDHWQAVSVPLGTLAIEMVEDEAGNLLALRIKEKQSGKPIQIIGPLENGYRSYKLQTGDYNGDGRMDIRILWQGEAPQATTYLYSRGKKLFAKKEN